MANKKEFKAPEMPQPTELGAPTVADVQGNWLQQHWDSGKYSYRSEDSLQPPPEPLTAKVTAENPLQVTFFNSIRSP